MTTEVEVRLKLVDGVSASLTKTAQAAESIANKSANAAAAAASKSASAIDRAAARVLAAETKTSATQQQIYARTSHAREVLGIRSEKAIQREIYHTEAAYKRLAAAGTASQNEIARASEATRQKIAALNREMGKMSAIQRAQNFAPKAVAAYWAASSTFKAPLMREMGYDERLTGLTNTAYAGKPLSARYGFKENMRFAVRKSVLFGGTREDATEALDNMIASGLVSPDDAMAVLPELVKSATASGSKASDLSNIAIRAMSTFKIKPEDIPNILNMAMTAGNMGGFELNNMSKWLPEQMAMAKNIGISGKSGLASLAAWNQATVITAGSKDQAGNNLRDLLNEVNTPHFARHLKKVGVKNAEQLFLDAQAKGVNKIDATVDLVNSLVSQDKRYKALQEKLKTVSPGEKQQVIEAMAAQVQGGIVGKIFHNQQSLMGLLGIMNNRDEIAKIIKSEMAADVRRGGETDTAYAFHESSPAFKTRRAEQLKNFSEDEVVSKLNPAINKTADAFTDLSAKYPQLAGASTLAATALGYLAVTTTVASIAQNGGSTGSVGALAKKYLPKVLKGGKLLTVGGVAALGATELTGAAFGEDSAISRYTGSVLGGTATGAAIGSFFPGPGTVVGGVVGGLSGAVYEGFRPKSPVVQSVMDKYDAPQRTLPSISHITPDMLQRTLSSIKLMNEGAARQNQEPAKVDANFTVTLAPGLRIVQQNSQTTNVDRWNIRVGQNGNLWKDVP